MDIVFLGWAAAFALITLGALAGCRRLSPPAPQGNRIESNGGHGDGA
ncbi:MAG: hypothetical protein AB1666_11805 [Pseudomonadota bacterium]|jgi:hypothetical protein|uniref:Uncharacterized protein n=2 Tax=Burkholderiales TaxID=80840 RepID=A0AA46HVD2_9BURK|nr:MULTISPECIES: hypothetical protein [Pseudomonadota]PNG83987.1 hypothetical protein CBL13_03835 [Pseudomonas putida]TCP06540.1 hypothetical protein EV676_10623 [Caldimonas thermodepolymerans]TSE21911.1 hypothetical protein Taqua_02229 [Tepidimonas aquatica]UZG49401.1 hypothetical protein ONS87_07210 [Caldimonas thermodepolymerans]